MIRPEQYMDRILAKFASTFDIEKPFRAGGREFPAYARFSSRSEKYVLVKEVNLWAAESYEYVLFLDRDEVTPAIADEVLNLAKNYMEPELVRGGKRYPEKDHMYSYMTVIVMSRKSPDRETEQAVQKLHFAKDYLFTVRGRSEVHLILVDCEKERILLNRDAKPHRKLYESIFDEIHEGRIGFDDLMRKGRA